MQVLGVVKSVKRALIANARRGLDHELAKAREGAKREGRERWRCIGHAEFIAHMRTGRADAVRIYYRLAKVTLQFTCSRRIRSAGSVPTTPPVHGTG
jgi:tRNA A37 N6-isopentenylltransferase MiaA